MLQRNISLLTLLLIGFISPSFLTTTIQATPRMVLGTAETPLSCGDSGLYFGEVEVGEEQLIHITIKNVGDSPLVITGYDLSSFEHFAIDLNSPGGSITIPPDNLHQIKAIFRPASEGSHNGYFSLHSNDPDNNPCPIKLAGKGILGFPFCVEYRHVHFPVGRPNVALFDEAVECDDEIYIDMNDYQEFGAFRTIFSLTNKTQEDIELCTDLETEEGSFPYFECQVVEPVNGELNVGIGRINIGWQAKVPGAVYSFIWTFTATYPNGEERVCKIFVKVDRSDLPEKCLSPFYTLDGGLTLNALDCGQEITIDETTSPGPITFPLQYYFFNNCPPTEIVSGETEYTWLGQTSSFGPSPVIGGFAAFHPVDDAILDPGGLYTYKTNFQIVGAPNQDCFVQINVDRLAQLHAPRAGSFFRQSDQEVLKLYPSVANQILQVEGIDQQEATPFRIFSQAGQLVSVGTIPPGIGSTNIQVSDIAEGQYFLSLEDHPKALPFIIQRN